MLLALISDSHGTVDPRLTELFLELERPGPPLTVVHAGDVGDHGGAGLVIERYSSGAAASSPSKRRVVHAVSGNVDLESDGLPEEILLRWGALKLLVRHIVGGGPKAIDGAARASIDREGPDVVVCGHSHIPACFRLELGGAWVVNPGSVGPARFKLKRAMAFLSIPEAYTGTEAKKRGVDDIAVAQLAWEEGTSASDFAALITRTLGAPSAAAGLHGPMLVQVWCGAHKLERVVGPKRRGLAAAARGAELEASLASGSGEEGKGSKSLGGKRKRS